MKLIGRSEQRTIFEQCEKSSQSKLIAVYGRRRVGKTFLIRKYFKSKISFEISGLHKASMKDQLEHFTRTLTRYGWKGKPIEKPASWFDAFYLLEQFIGKKISKTKKVIFLDELPWFDTPRSKFLSAFENFWNSFCSNRPDIILIICGSAASWMIKKIVKNKGGLHNRLSEKIRLAPFNLNETKQFLQEKGIKWSQLDMVQLYMVTGGVPFYLDAVKKGESVGQFIERACFTENGTLINEYSILFESLFDNSDRHYSIVKALSTKRMGLTRGEIITQTKMDSGGTLTQSLFELEESGFIEVLSPFQQIKTKSLYKLVDHFTLFYWKFMHNNKMKNQSNWIAKMNSQAWISWSGLAFERVCYSHLQQIKHTLKLEAIHCDIYPWKKDKVTQIDMVIDRSDRISQVCEIKFSKSPFTITKSYAQNLRTKLAEFSSLKENKRKTQFLTMITTFGVTENEYSTELVQNQIMIDDLFINR